MVEVSAGAVSAMVEIRYSHTNIAKIEKNGITIFFGDENEATGGGLTDRSVLTLENIKQFADEVPLNLVRPMIERQIRYNMDIAYEGISGDYGLGIGRVLRESYADGVVTRMKAYAAAASEARMSGCDMTVIINSGS